MKKAVLAYSGGLDTSCVVTWLKDKGYKVICFVADVGQGEDFQAIQQRAYAAGASKVYIQDLKEEFLKDFVLPTLQAGAVYEGKYFLATALSRPLIARHLVEIAHKEKANAVAHGCTGKGNDQVRFELSISILDPQLEIIAPVREWEFKSREEEIDYARKHNIPIEATKQKPYSIDRNLWGISIEGGVLEDLDKEPPEDAYLITRAPSQQLTYPKYIEIYFQQGIPRKVDGKKYNLEDLVNYLNETGGNYGVGRVDLVENRLVGIKSREIYEAPAATILYTAYQELESLVLDRELLHFKQIISLKYSELVYYGLWYTPLKEALDGFVATLVRYINGAVRLKLFKGSCIPVGRKSDYSLYKKELATYGPQDKFNQKLAEGFIKIWGMPYRKG